MLCQNVSDEIIVRKKEFVKNFFIKIIEGSSITLNMKKTDELFTKKDLDEIKNFSKRVFYSLYSNIKIIFDDFEKKEENCIVFGFYYRKYQSNILSNADSNIIKIVKNNPFLILYTYFENPSCVKKIKNLDIEFEIDDDDSKKIIIDNTYYNVFDALVKYPSYAISEYICENLELFENEMYIP